MAKGRQGFMLEAWKFVVYLSIPVGASIYWNDPDRQKKNADYWQFIKYPPSDPEKVREEVQERIKREQRQKEHQQAYLEQMKRLKESAERSQKAALEHATSRSDNSSKRGGLWGWLGFRTKETEDS